MNTTITKAPFNKTSKIIGAPLLVLTIFAVISLFYNWQPMWIISTILALDGIYLLTYAGVCFKYKNVLSGITAVSVVLMIVVYYAMVYPVYYY